MAALKFPSSHNMVAFLDKPAESDAFEQIVDFLNVHPIKYALTVNPTIYTSCIEQFWTIANVKTVNEEVQIQALVDKKKVIITKTSVRSDLQLEDAEGTECLPNAIIFEQLTLIGQGKDFSGRDTPLFPTMIVQAQEQVGEGSEIPTDSHHTSTTTQPLTSKPQKKQSRRKQRKDTEDPQLSGTTEPVTDDTKNVASVPTHSNDPLLSDEDRLKLTELMKLCTKLAERVLALETTKINQALEIDSLKRRVKKLEKKKGGSRTHRLKRLYKVGRSARVVSSKDEGLGEQKDASKQGRKIDEIDQDAEVTLVNETQGRYEDNLMFDTSVLDNEQDMAEKEVDMAEKDVSTADPVTTVGEVVTTANVDSTTTTIVDELTLAQTLIEIKVAKPKAITTAATTTTTAVTKPKARGVALYFINKRKKHFARLRAEEQRSKPPTKAQKRNTMSTYLKNMARYKHNQFKTKSFKDIQMLFDKEMKRVNTFVDMDTELVKGSETRTEGSSKRAGEELESENLKKQKLDENVEVEVDNDQEEAEMKKHMEIVPDDEVITDAIPLATKPPIIIDWKIIKE
ncbi:hypothetical protein Tco_0828870 [Tanacetum coccineum]